MTDRVIVIRLISPPAAFTGGVGSRVPHAGRGTHKRWQGSPDLAHVECNARKSHLVTGRETRIRLPTDPWEYAVSISCCWVTSKDSLVRTCFFYLDIAFLPASLKAPLPQPEQTNRTQPANPFSRFVVQGKWGRCVRLFYAKMGAHPSRSLTCSSSIEPPELGEEDPLSLITG